ncbi:MAG: ATP-grasp domain-containing protein [Alistipes sp.]|nr:ATP-grasp domain-containing protein [Alistipes sp.]
MKKVLMIGAGIGQVPISLLAKDRGYYLIVVTIPGDYPCIELADKVYYVDIFKREEVLRIAKEEKIDAVISDQNDLMMPTVAYVAEHLSLPGNTFSQVDAYCNKNIFRQNSDILGIPVPKHTRVLEVRIPDEFKEIPFPWMVKPEDSQSSIGVSKVNSTEEYFAAIEHALKCSRNGAAIVEEFFVGDEIVVEGFIYKGEYFNLGIADRRYFNLPNIFIPSQTIFPSTISDDIKQQCIECEQKMCQYINPRFAIVHAEYLVNQATGEIRIVESALRGGGVYISSHLLPMACGINISSYLLDCSLGIETDFKELYSSLKEGASAYICFYLPKGIVKSVEGIELIKSLFYVHKCDIDASVGDETKQMTYKGQRLGPIIISGKDRNDIEDKIHSIQSSLTIEVENSEGDINGIIWN